MYNIHLALSLWFAANVKVKVKCNQTGKTFMSSVHHLEDQDCNPITTPEEGASVFWTDGTSGYPVTILKIVTTSGIYIYLHTLMSVHANVTLILLFTQVLERRMIK